MNAKGQRGRRLEVSMLLAPALSELEGMGLTISCGEKERRQDLVLRDVV